MKLDTFLFWFSLVVALPLIGISFYLMLVRQQMLAAALYLPVVVVLIGFYFGCRLRKRSK